MMGLFVADSLSEIELVVFDGVLRVASNQAAFAVFGTLHRPASLQSLSFRLEPCMMVHGGLVDLALQANPYLVKLRCRRFPFPSRPRVVGNPLLMPLRFESGSPPDEQIEFGLW